MSPTNADPMWERIRKEAESEAQSIISDIIDHHNSL